MRKFTIEFKGEKQDKNGNPYHDTIDIQTKFFENSIEAHNWARRQIGYDLSVSCLITESTNQEAQDE